jgi:transcriptional regulator with GAF, ATPase, and Fis domain
MPPTATAADDRAAEPRLVAIAGPLGGEVLPMSADTVTIGRDPASTICLSDLALSRRHCVIARTAEGWRIRDLKSFNGTFVNGMQITEHLLADGDRLSLGGSTFVFVQKPSEEVALQVVADQPGASTTTLRPEAAVYLQWGPVTGVADHGRFERGLKALLKISTAINAIRHEQELHRTLLDLLAETVAADQLAIVLTDARREITAVHVPPGATRPLRISRTALRRAVEEGVAVLSRDRSGSRGFPLAESVVSAGIHAVLCVPICVRDRILGAIYLAASTSAEAFDNDHLQLVTAIGSVAAIALDNVRQCAWLESETERLQADLQVEHSLVGNSASMQRVYERIGRVARSDATVLITGETGTGKELAARAIHLNGARAKRPFVAINCAALTETLLETELFGHERGAFTGAVAQKKGKFEIADGGTIFLDEVGELASAMQSKLLRALQAREFERVGGTRPIKVDVRVIAATNRELDEEVRARRFREDLFHRLNVVAIEMPPLRERREDIPLLVNHFLGRLAAGADRRIRRVSPAAMLYLTGYDWPGNVRELENTIERALVLGTSGEILPEDLPEPLLESTPTGRSGLTPFHEAVRQTKQRVIIEAFRKAQRNYAQTARLLGLHPNYLHRLIRNLDLKRTLEEDRA